VCLGAQLLATALGARVRPGAAKELGFAPVTLLDPSDPLLSGLGPSAVVLHWHGEVFDLPASATLLARSELTQVQAFRAANAWGLLFHAEADAELLELWLAEPAMASEAREVLGENYAAVLREALQHMPKGVGGSVFAAFAAHCAQRG
jgi:GMP synthase (glutamine-hydrolysing)